MPWNTPETWTSGNVASASMMNREVRDNMNYVHSGKPATAINRNAGAAYTPSTSFADLDATNLSIALSLTTGRVAIAAQCTFKAANADSMDCFLDVAIDGVRQGGTNGIVVKTAVDPKTRGVGFTLDVTGLAVGDHTFTLQAKQAYVGTPGTILSSAASLVHFSVREL